MIDCREASFSHRLQRPSARIACFTDCHLPTVSRWLVRVASGEAITDRPRGASSDLYRTTGMPESHCLLLPGCSRWTLRDAEEHLMAHPEVIECSTSGPTLGRIPASKACAHNPMHGSTGIAANDVATIPQDHPRILSGDEDCGG